VEEVLLAGKALKVDTRIVLQAAWAHKESAVFN
jgi:Pyruvate/2-oxoacid:ferredoxin oxidoreductase delta subunit